MRLNRNIMLLTVCVVVSMIFTPRAPVRSMPVMGGGCSATPLTFSGAIDIDYTTINGTGPGRINIGTDGSMTYSGSFSGPAAGTPGVIVVNGQHNCDIEISCASTATLSDGGTTIAMDSIEVVVRSNQQTSFGNGNACAGLGNVVATGRTHNNSDFSTIYVGGSINSISGTIPGGPDYSTAISGGTSLQFEVNYINP